MHYTLFSVSEIAEYQVTSEWFWKFFTHLVCGWRFPPASPKQGKSAAPSTMVGNLHPHYLHMYWVKLDLIKLLKLLAVEKMTPSTALHA